jgi:hypothetical protein
MWLQLNQGKKIQLGAIMYKKPKKGSKTTNPSGKIKKKP